MDHLFLFSLEFAIFVALLMSVAKVPGKSQQERQRRIIALGLLAILNSAALVIGFWSPNTLQQLQGSVAILTILGTTWAFIRPALFHYARWRWYLWGGTLLWLFSAVVGLQLQAMWSGVVLLVFVWSIPLLITARPQLRWVYIAPVLIFAMSALAVWFEATDVGQLLYLFAYSALVYAVFVETVAGNQQRRQEVESLGSETRRMHTERQRMVETSHAINSVENPAKMAGQSVKGIVRHSGLQMAALLLKDATTPNRVRPTILYRHKQGLHHFDDAAAFDLTEFDTLIDAEENLQTILATPQSEELTQLYRYLQQSDLGPTLIHPLVVNQQVAGFLVGGHFNRQKPIQAADIRLCQSLAPQIATIVTQMRHHQLAAQALAIATAEKETLATRYQMLAEAFNHSTDGILVSDAQGIIQQANQRASEILGLSKLVGIPISTVYGSISIGETVIEDLAAKFSRNNDPIPTYFERNEQQVKGALHPIRNQKNEWQGTILILRDITAEMAAKQASRDFVETLNAQLRTTLATIKGYSALMHAGAAGELDRHKIHFLEIIDRGVDKVAERLAQSLDAVSGHLSPAQLDISDLDMNDLLNAVSENVTHLVSRRQLNLTVHVSSDISSLKGDAAQLQYAFTHLLERACKATPQGGYVSLAVRADDLNGENIADDRYLIAAIRDNGIGISTQAEQQTFNRTFKASKPHDEAKIKAAIETVEQVITAHNGRIWFENIGGQQHIIYVALPLQVITI